MKIEELRIGNWIETKKNFTSWEGTKGISSPKKIKIFGLEFFEKLVYDNEIWLNIEEFSPISINKLWLLKLGFVKNQNHGIENYLTSDSNYYPDNKQFKIFDRFGGYIYVENIEFVHQLQNLYFALTQKEL